MTVGELEKILQGIADKDTAVVVFDQQKLGNWTTCTHALPWQVTYTGNGTYVPLGKKPGEPENVLVIQ